MKKRVLSIIMAAVMLLPVLVIPSGAAAKLDKPVISVSVEGDNPVISWNAVKNAADYYVYRLNFETRKYTEIADTKELTFTDAKVKSNTLQQYIVTAVDENKSKSDKSSPKNTIAKPTNLKATATTDSVKLTWSKSLNATHYVVEQATGLSTTYKAIKSTKNTSITITGLKSGTSYKFRIRPRVTVNDKYYYGLRSSAVTIKTKQAEKAEDPNTTTLDIKKYKNPAHMPNSEVFTCLRILLEYYGLKLTNDEIIKYFEYSNDFYMKDGELHGPNIFYYFYGDPYSDKPEDKIGVGISSIYLEVKVLKILKEYLNGFQIMAVSRTDNSFAINDLKQGTPILVEYLYDSTKSDEIVRWVFYHSNEKNTWFEVLGNKYGIIYKVDEKNLYIYNPTVGKTEVYPIDMKFKEVFELKKVY